MFVYSQPQQGDLRLSGPTSGQGASDGARTRDREVPADLRVDLQASGVTDAPLELRMKLNVHIIDLIVIAFHKPSF
ncbi:hypothetical protein PoB_003226500 [Plakobranchus ocellatus]|uniref:Uncharacterized protein n=1 Tax=Plakobranchus ocellatus TaxID=259542 RepID=A0AAV4AG89_9GAST|nr:hypothetical protein PoB_003226500 [Plakobranchus ocellatus]